jgi:methionyl-tRNA synthetase
MRCEQCGKRINKKEGYALREKVKFCCKEHHDKYWSIDAVKHRLEEHRRKIELEGKKKKE